MRWTPRGEFLRHIALERSRMGIAAWVRLIALRSTLLSGGGLAHLVQTTNLATPHHRFGGSPGTSPHLHLFVAG